MDFRVLAKCVTSMALLTTDITFQISYLPIKFELNNTEPVAELPTPTFKDTIHMYKLNCVSVKKTHSCVPT